MVAASAGRLPPSGGEREHPERRNPDRMTVVKESMLNWMVIERSISQETPYFVSRAVIIDHYGRTLTGLKRRHGRPDRNQQRRTVRPATTRRRRRAAWRMSASRRTSMRGGAQSSRKRRRKEGDVDDGDGEEEVEEDDARGQRGG